jgi:prepilin-type N-terminal cleavage/methylation domain-containing protein
VKDRRGFTLVEVMIVVCILGLLAAIATPKVQAARAHARAADVLGAMRAVRIAATIYYDSATAWPANAAAGVIPAKLAGYLPRSGIGIFTGNGWTMRWKTVNVVSGGITTIDATMQIKTTDPLLCLPLSNLLGGPSATVTVACNAASGKVTQTIER